MHRTTKRGIPEEQRFQPLPQNVRGQYCESAFNVTLEGGRLRIHETIMVDDLTRTETRGVDDTTSMTKTTSEVLVVRYDAGLVTSVLS